MTWIECVKSVKSAIAKKSPVYNQSGSMTIVVNGKTIKLRTDCSGYVSAVLIAYGVVDGTFTTNSTGFSHDANVATKLAKAGFTKKAFTSWDSLTNGCIISDDYSHVEIFDKNVGAKHYVYSNGSTNGMRSATSTLDGGKHTYDTVWFPPTVSKTANATTTVESSSPISPNFDADLRDLQCAISDDGIATLTRDGLYGNKTDTALKKVVVKSGSKGNVVAWVQCRVGCTPDGNAGAKTKAAIVAYQNKKGLTADGCAGYNTIRAILKDYGCKC